MLCPHYFGDDGYFCHDVAPLCLIVGLVSRLLRSRNKCFTVFEAAGASSGVILGFEGRRNSYTIESVCMRLRSQRTSNSLPVCPHSPVVTLPVQQGLGVAVQVPDRVLAAHALLFIVQRHEEGRLLDAIQRSLIDAGAEVLLPCVEPRNPEGGGGGGGEEIWIGRYTCFFFYPLQIVLRGNHLQATVWLISLLELLAVMHFIFSRNEINSIDIINPTETWRSAATHQICVTDQMNADHHSRGHAELEKTKRDGIRHHMTAERNEENNNVHSNSLNQHFWFV